jgi:hypothetical protein
MCKEQEIYIYIYIYSKSSEGKMKRKIQKRREIIIEKRETN